jgi:hypothetical protein
MKSFKVVFSILMAMACAFSWTISNAGGQDYYGNEDPNKKILKQGLLGAGVGAISAEASGGKAGTGALVGAGTNVIGGALLDSLTTPSQPQPQYAQQPVYVQQSQPQYVQSSSSYPVQTQSSYQRVEQQPVYYQQAPAPYYPPQEDPNKKIIKSGLLGAGVGAISASASGGSAGKGALIGAGTNVIGGALLDSLMSPSPQPQAQPVYYQQAPQYQQSSSSSTTQPKKKIIRKYDSDGNIVSEEEVWE